MMLVSRLRARPVAQALFLATAVAAAVGLASCGEQAQPTPTSLAVAATATTANATRTRGDIVFAKYCNSCHPGGARGAGPALPGIDKDEFVEYVRKGKGRMPAFNEGLISNEEFDQMYEYISSLKK
jgi:mono/diheme cytochrome c family protein